MILLLAADADANGVSLGGLMQHVTLNVGAPIDGQFPLVAAFDEDPGEGFGMILAADDLTGQFEVLSGRAYSAQFGWLRQGPWAPASGEGAFFRLVEQSAGLSVYQGAFGVDVGGDGQSDNLNGAHTLVPILGTDDAPDYWRWDGRMTHNWYASDIAGPHFATYDFFVADVLPDGSPGTLSPTFLPTQVTVNWIDNVTPAGFLDGDYDGSGFVSQADLDLVLLNWGDSVVPAEWVATQQFDGQLVSQNELDGVLLNWGSGQPPTAAVLPEPSTAGLLLAALGMGAARIRRPSHKIVKRTRQTP